jgi:hypothetical protein
MKMEVRHLRLKCYYQLTMLLISLFAHHSTAMASESVESPKSIDPPQLKQVSHKQRVIHPSMIRVIANPKLFNGKRLRLFGFLESHREGEGLWLSKDFYDSRICSNAIGVSVNRSDLPAILSLTEHKSLDDVTDRYVCIVGTYYAPLNDNFMQWSGRLDKIESINVLWPASGDFERPKN